MGTNTTNYSFFKPEPSVDKNWGAAINTNFDDIDTLIFNLRDDVDNYLITVGGSFDTRLTGVETVSTNNAAAITALQAQDVTHTTNIATNAADILTNAGDITALQAQDGVHTTNIGTNTVNIAGNATNISDHRTDFLVEHAADGTHTSITATDFTLGTGVSAYTFPNSDGSNTNVLITDGAGTLYWGDPEALENDSLDSVTTRGPNTGNTISVGGLTIGYPSAATDYTFPTVDGTNNQILVTDGGGNVTWQNSSATTPTLQAVCDTGNTSDTTVTVAGLTIDDTVNPSYTIPTQDGTGGYWLATDGAGTVAFTNNTAANVNIVDAGGIITATDVEGALQENRTAIDLNTTHAGSDGSDHGFIDQDVTSGSSPTFDGNNFTGVDADDVDIADGGGIITATDVEGALQENRTAIDLNTTHRGSNGSDHSFIDQDVTSGSSPTFDGNNFSGIDADDVDIADAGGLITATDVEGALAEHRGLINSNTSASHTRSHTMTSTSDHSATNWSLFYSNGSGEINEVALGSNTQVLVSNGPAVAPTFQNQAAGFADPMTTRGDIIIRDATNTTTRLAIGGAGTYLTSDGTDISWGAGSGGGDFSNGGEAGGANRTLGNTDAYSLGFETTDIVRLSIAAGGAITFNSAFTFPTSDGSADQVLTTNGTGTLTWNDQAATPAGADGQIQFNSGGSALGADANFIFDTTNDRLAIGTPTHDGELRVVDLAANCRQYLDTYSTTVGDASALILRKSAQNTEGLTETAATDVLGTIGFQGVDNTTAHDYGAFIQVVQDGASGVNVPADMTLATYSSTGVNTNQVVLNSDGTVTFSNFTFPTADGAGDQVLTTNGTGTLTWNDQTGFDDPMTTRGDIIIRDATNTTARLAIGTNGQMLTTDGTDISWGDAYSDPMTTRGDVLIRDASNTTARLAVGANGTVLTSDGTDVSWVAGLSDPMTTRGDIIYRNASNTTARLAVGTAGQVLTSDGTDTAWATQTGAVNFVIDGGGAVIATGIKGDIQIPFDATITAATLLADQSGSIVVDVWKDTYANYPATDADSITASAVPTITTATKSTDSTLTGWTTAITAGDILRFNVDSCTTITRCTVVIEYTRA